jgi:nitrile hydratase
MAHDHDHDDHDHEHGSELSEMQLRVRALESILTEKGYVEPAALDAIIEAYETRIGPHNGARVVAKAWSDPQFKQALLEDATAAVSTLGHVSRVGDHLVAVENTPERTTWSCARFAPAIRGKCSGCPRSGTRPRPTAPAP